MKTRSIVRNATVMVLAVELICGVVLCGTAILHERHARFHELDEMLRGSADSLVGAVQDAEDPEDHVTVNPEEFRIRRGDLYAVYAPDRRLIGTSEDSAKILLQQTQNGFRDLQLNGHRYRVYQREALRIIDRYETGGVGIRRPFTVVYAIPMDHIWHEIVSATQFYVLFSAALLGLAAVLLVLLLRRLLRPLAELAASASAIDARSLHFAPPESSLHIQELHPVADAITQSMTRLRAAFELQRRFISDASHELKTAVAIVRSTVQILALRAHNMEQYKTGLNQVLVDNSRVEELVAQMLTLASVEENRAGIAGSCQFSEQVQTVLGKLGDFASLRGVTLRATCERACTVPLPAEAVQTLISNLVTNAIQHSVQGSEVDVRYASAGDPAKTILEVQDHGSGIAPETLPHVFERFFREDASRSRQTGGTGLGLAICKSIVEKAGGEIHIQSKLGIGTSVTVIFPTI